MRKRQEIPLFGNLTAMIDVVFQIIIFFVCTSNLQSSSIDTRIELARAPHGQPVTKKLRSWNAMSIMAVRFSSPACISCCFRFRAMGPPSAAANSPFPSAPQS